MKSIAGLINESLNGELYHLGDVIAYLAGFSYEAPFEVLDEKQVEKDFKGCDAGWLVYEGDRDVSKDEVHAFEKLEGDVLDGAEVKEAYDDLVDDLEDAPKDIQIFPEGEPNTTYVFFFDGIESMGYLHLPWPKRSANVKKILSQINSDEFYFKF